MVLVPARSVTRGLVRGSTSTDTDDDDDDDEGDCTEWEWEWCAAQEKYEHVNDDENDVREFECAV